MYKCQKIAGVVKNSPLSKNSVEVIIGLDKKSSTPRVGIRGVRVKKSFSVMIEQNEYWWGGAVIDGGKMPLSQESEYTLDNRINGTYNQVNGLFTSTHGRYVYVDGEFYLQVKEGVLFFTEVEGEWDVAEGFGTLRGAYKAAFEKHCSRRRDIPAELLLKPQYCTWMECLKDSSQEKVIAYAQGILDAGLPAGVLILDDGWSYDYGDWRFDKSRFPNPKQMMDDLHKLGFTVMIWICPFVNETSKDFIKLKEQNAMVREADGRVAIREWWNGFSGVLDLTNPTVQAYFKGVLDDILALGADGFKFDAGDAFYYCYDDVTYAPTTPNGQSILWAELAAEYAYSELRACVALGGEAVIQRLCDKRSDWSEREGIGSLIPNMLQAGMSGYIYCCADMIGGGQGNPNNRIDYQKEEEFLSRSCECAALLPCMQFSYALWREGTTPATREAVKRYANLRVEMSEYFTKTLKQCEAAGEPIVQPLEYAFPNQGFAKINNVFMLGEKYLVAPVVKKGVRTVTLTLPKGSQWRYVPDGTTYAGGEEVTVAADVAVLPYFEKIKS